MSTCPGSGLGLVSFKEGIVTGLCTGGGVKTLLGSGDPRYGHSPLPPGPRSTKGAVVVWRLERGLFGHNGDSVETRQGRGKVRSF